MVEHCSYRGNSRRTGIGSRANRTLRSISRFHTRVTWYSPPPAPPVVCEHSGQRCINVQCLPGDPLDAQVVDIKLTLHLPLLKSVRTLNERTQHFEACQDREPEPECLLFPCSNSSGIPSTSVATIAHRASRASDKTKGRWISMRRQHKMSHLARREMDRLERP